MLNIFFCISTTTTSIFRPQKHLVTYSYYYVKYKIICTEVFVD